MLVLIIFRISLDLSQVYWPIFSSLIFSNESYDEIDNIDKSISYFASLGFREYISFSLIELNFFFF